MTDVAFGGSVVLPDGTKLPVSGSANVVSPGPATVFGIDIPTSSTEPAATTALFPVNGYSRIYSSTGINQRPWTYPSVAFLTKMGCELHFSFKSFVASDVQAHMDAIPSSVKKVRYTYHHEPENDTEPISTFLSYTAQLAKLARSSKNAAKIETGPIYIWYRKFVNNIDWTPWWSPTLDVDFVGWDVQLSTSITVYTPPPATLVSQLQSTVNITKKPLIVPELGFPRIPTDATGSGRAAYLKDIASGLESLECSRVGWWQFDTRALTSGPDYTLYKTLTGA